MATVNLVGGFFKSFHSLMQQKNTHTHTDQINGETMKPRNDHAHRLYKNRSFPEGLRPCASSCTLSCTSLAATPWCICPRCCRKGKETGELMYRKRGRALTGTSHQRRIFAVNYSFFLVTVKVSQWAYLLVTVGVSKSRFLKHIVTIVTVSDRVCCYFVELRRYGHQLTICGRWMKKHVPLQFFDLVVQAWVLWTDIWGYGLIFGCISQAFDFFL